MTKAQALDTLREFLATKGLFLFPSSADSAFMGIAYEENSPLEGWVGYIRTERNPICVRLEIPLPPPGEVSDKWSGPMAEFSTLKKAVNHIIQKWTVAPTPVPPVVKTIFDL